MFKVNNQDTRTTSLTSHRNLLSTFFYFACNVRSEIITLPLLDSPIFEDVLPPPLPPLPFKKKGFYQTCMKLSHYSHHL